MSPFCGATDTPVLDFWWHLLWVSKPEWAALFALGGGIHVTRSLKFTSIVDTCWPLGSQHGSRAVSSTYLRGIGSFLRFRLIKTPPSQYLTFPKCVAIKESVLQILGWIFSQNISLQKRNCGLRLNVELIGLLWMRTESVLEWCLWQENKIFIGGSGGGGGGGTSIWAHFLSF